MAIRRLTISSSTTRPGRRHARSSIRWGRGLSTTIWATVCAPAATGPGRTRRMAVRSFLIWRSAGRFSKAISAGRRSCCCRPSSGTLSLTRFWRSPFELGVRFFTDHLRGNTYFKVGREGDNLVRAVRQFRLVEDIVRNGGGDSPVCRRLLARWRRLSGSGGCAALIRTHQRHKDSCRWYRPDAWLQEYLANSMPILVSSVYRLRFPDDAAEFLFLFDAGQQAAENDVVGDIDPRQGRSPCV